MDPSKGLLFAILWGLARFGVPVLVTGLIIAILSKFDSKWEEDAIASQREEYKGGLIPLMKCWVFMDCPPERREKCPAYKEKYLPCWQVFRDENDYLKEACLDCPVFRNAPIPIT